MSVRVANAPLSYGAFEMTVGTDFAVPDPEQVLAAIGDAGYEARTSARPATSARAIRSPGAWRPTTSMSWEVRPHTILRA